MPYYSDDIIEEVRSRNDIVDVISQYVRLSKKGSTYFGLCPFHNSLNSVTISFTVSPCTVETSFDYHSRLSVAAALVILELPIMI